MKIRLLLLCSLAICAAPLLAADPVVVIADTDIVTINGASFGKVADSIANNPTLAPAIQRALDTHLATLRADRSAATGELATLTEFAHQLVDRAAAALAAGDIETLRKIIAAARAPKVAREKEALEKEAEAAQARLAEIAARQAALDSGVAK